MIISGYHSLTSYWIISLLKGDFPYHLGPCPFPSFQAPDLCASRLGFCPSVGPIEITEFWGKPHKILVFMKIPHPNRAFSLWVFLCQKTTFVTQKQKIQDSMTLMVIVTVWTGIDENHDPWFQRTVWFMSTQNTEQFSVSLKEFDSWDRKDHFTTMTPNRFPAVLSAPSDSCSSNTEHCLWVAWVFPAGNAYTLGPANPLA